MATTIKFVDELIDETNKYIEECDEIRDTIVQRNNVRSITRPIYWTVVGTFLGYRTYRYGLPIANGLLALFSFGMLDFFHLRAGQYKEDIQSFEKVSNRLRKLEGDAKQLKSVYPTSSVDEQFQRMNRLYEEQARILGSMPMPPVGCKYPRGFN